MSYDYTPTGWYATFDRKQSRGKIVQQPVEAWSSDGDALVVDERTGRLIPANALAGFQSLQPCSRVVLVIPAAEGWQMNFPAEEGSGGFPEPWSRPVIGWVVDMDGDAKPLMPLDDGTASAHGWPKGGTLTWPGRDVPSASDSVND